MPGKRPLPKKTLIIGLIGLAITAGLLAGGVRLVDRLAPQYRHALVERIGDQLGASVQAEGLKLRWRWGGPVLVLDEVVIKKPGASQPALRLSALGLYFSFVDLAQGGRLPDGLRLHEPQFGVVVHDDYSLSIAHWPSQASKGFDWQRLAEARATLDSVVIRDARIDIRMPSLPPHMKQGQIRIDDLDATMSDAGKTLTATLSARARGWLDRLRVEAAVTGPLPDFTTARLELETDNLATLRLLQVLKPAGGQSMAPLSGGATDIQLSARWAQHRFDTGDARLRMAAVRAAGLEEPLLPALTATFSARQATAHAGVVNISLDTLSGALPGVEQIHASARVETGENTVTLRARNLAAGLFAPFVRRRFDALAEARVQGIVDSLEAAFVPGAPMRLALAFDRLRIETPTLAAGPVSGQYYQQGKKHVLTFSGAGGTLRVDHYLRGALPVTDLAGELNWHATGGGWLLRAADLQLTSGQATLQTNATVRFSSQGAPVADVHATLQAPDVARLLAHIPQADDLPNPRLRDWLPEAIPAGGIEASVRLSGPLDQFPFADGGGRFTVELRGSDVTLAYKPAWPALTNLEGTMTLDGDTLTIAARKGKILGVTVGPGTARIENVREPVLFVDGAVKDAAADEMMSFLARSPLSDRFGTLVEVLDVGGTAGLAIELRVPLKPGLGELKVSGVIHAQGNSLGHDALPAPIEAITGRIAFDRSGLQAQDLRGRLMGLELTTDIEPASGANLSIVTRTRLALPEHRELLAHYLPPAWLTYAQGNTAARVSLRISTDAQISDLTITSNLEGMALTLPPPLSKPAGTATEMTLRLADAGQLTLDYGGQLHLDMAFENGRLQRAAALFGPNPAIVEPPAGPGLWLGGRIGQLNAAGWVGVINDVRDAHKAGNDDSESGLAFRGADLVIADLRAGSRQLRHVQLRARPLTEDQGWRFHIDGPNARGQATWRPDPGGRGLLSARLSLLALNTLPGSEPPAVDTTQAPVNEDSRILAGLSPTTLPALNIDIASLSVEATDFGGVVIDAAGLSHGWLLNRVQISGGELSVLASGRWTRNAGLTQAALDVQIDGRGLASLMRTLGYSAAIKAETVALRTHLEIVPNDNGLDLRALNGDLALKLTDGALMSIEPGAGRLLGLLNLYVLPRRLMLDFSDVIDQGLAFDKIQGTFNIVSGNAYTDSLTIQTPSSIIRIDGRIGLAARDYDETVTIVPKFGSSLTLAGAVLGGPAVGAVVFAIQQLLEEPIQEAASITYTLQGSWDDPEIVQPRVKE